MPPRNENSQRVTQGWDLTFRQKGNALAVRFFWILMVPPLLPRSYYLPGGRVKSNWSKFVTATSVKKCFVDDVSNPLFSGTSRGNFQLFQWFARHGFVPGVTEDSSLVF